MKKEKFVEFRKSLKKTQQEMAWLLGISVKAVRSYEQGWRNIPMHVMRHILFLCYLKNKLDKGTRPCWMVIECHAENKSCPARMLDAGTLCWFITGTFCEGRPHETWDEKISVCRKCPAFHDDLKYLME